MIAWAKVGADGTLLAGSGVARVSKVGRGRYALVAQNDISGAALIGTIDTGGGSDPGPGSASILVGAENATTVFVRTATPSAGSPNNVDDDRPFSVVFVN